MVKVLIVDDSGVIRNMLRHAFESDPDMEVVGEAVNGVQAVTMTAKLRPDVVTMDFEMPDMNGIEATRRIMQECPTPIVIISAVMDPEEASANFTALEAGALSIIQKPRLSGDKTAEALQEIAATVKSLSEVRVVRRLRRADPKQPDTDRAHDARGEPPIPPTHPVPIRAVAVGASTGGPQALQQLLDSMPPGFDAPMLVTQHIAAGFLQGMVNWLNHTSALPVSIGREGEIALPGRVYFAPEGRHMGLDKTGVIRLQDGPAVGGLQPAANYMFKTLAESVKNAAIGVLLTGMGKDGAEELLTLSKQGAITIAQDKATSVVHGMPGAAIGLGAARFILPLQAMAPFLAKTLSNTGGVSARRGT